MEDSREGWLLKHPHIKKRNGMNIVSYFFVANSGGSVNGEIITNAYGNGYFNPKPEIIPEDLWEKMKIEAKSVELAANHHRLINGCKLYHI